MITLNTELGKICFRTSGDTIYLIEPYQKAFKVDALDLDVYEAAAVMAHLYLKKYPGDMDGAAEAASAFGLLCYNAPTLN